VAVAGPNEAAAPVFDVLTEGGFNTAAGVVGKGEVDSPVRGAAIVYREGLEAEAKVVGSYAGGLELIPVPASALPDGVDVAVVANAAYEIPPPDTSGGQECPS
jgi:hypothetical protein